MRKAKVTSTKTKPQIISEVTSTEMIVASEKPKIGRLDIDLGRVDLNLMRDKINEIVDKLND